MKYQDWNCGVCHRRPAWLCVRGAATPPFRRLTAHWMCTPCTLNKLMWRPVEEMYK